MFSIHRVIGLTSILFALGACGGGSSSSGDSGVQPPPPTTPAYTVTTSVTGSGTGSISPTSRTVSQGSTASFSISPAAGSTIAGVSGCGGSLTGTTYTTGAITAACSVTANFGLVVTTPPEPFSLEATPGDQQITLTWPDQDVDTYNLCKAREPILEIENCGLYDEGELLLDVQGPPLVVSQLENDILYYFRLEALSSDGRLVSVLAEGVPLSAPALLARSKIYVADRSEHLGIVDPVTGSVEVVGDMTVLMTDIAFHPGGALYGISASSLYKINKNTGYVRRIGSHGIPSGNALAFSDSGILLAAGSFSTNLFELDPATGQTSDLGNTGYYSEGDLAYYQGDLFLSASNGDLVRLDLAEPWRSVSVGSLARSNVYGLAPGSDGLLYGAAGTDIFAINPETGSTSDANSFSGYGLSDAYGLAESKPPVFPIADYLGDPTSKVTTCFGAFGPDNGTKLTYVGEGLFHPAVDLAFVAGTPVQAPTSGVLAFYRRPNTGDLMQTFFVLEGDDGRSYIFAHVNCNDDVCDMSAPVDDIRDAYPVESRQRVARGQVLGVIGKLDEQHLHFGVVTGAIINADGTLLNEFRDGDVTWATVRYGSATVPSAEDARQLARARGFIDPLSLYVRPTGCESLHMGLVGLMSSTVAIRVENSGDFTDGPYEAFVEPAVEFDLGPGATGRTVKVSVDIGDGTIVFDYGDAGTGSFATSSFNGYVIELATGDLTWASVEVDPSTTLQLDADRVSFDEKSIRVNVSGLQYSSSSKIVLSIDAERQ